MYVKYCRSPRKSKNVKLAKKLKIFAERKPFFWTFIIHFFFMAKLQRKIQLINAFCLEKAFKNLKYWKVIHSNTKKQYRIQQSMEHLFAYLPSLCPRYVFSYYWPNLVTLWLIFS